MRRDDWKKVNQALADGLVRETGERASPSQTLAYILSDRKFFHHATLHSAKAEKEFLRTALGRHVRIYKVWNTSRESILADMDLVRSQLSKSINWGDAEQAMDRILAGAGY